MNPTDDNPITLLFDAIETLGDEDLLGELGEDLPPYPMLLPLLLDWASTTEAEDSPHTEAYEVLLNHTLQSMRVDLRQGASEAQACWTLLQELLGESLTEGDNPLLCQSLLHTLALFDFPMPETLLEQAGRWHFGEFRRLDAEGEMENQPQLPTAILDEMLENLEPDSPVDIYETLKAELYFLPADGLDVLLQELLRAEQPLVREAALLFLLHARAVVRDQLLSLLPLPGILDGIDARGRDRLIMLRNWLPVEQGTRLDPVIKQLRLRNLPSSGRADPSASDKLWACGMDGSGATAVIALTTPGPSCRLSGAIFKERVGIVDCWQSPPMKKKEAERKLKELREYLPQSLPMSREYLEQLVPHYLSLNCGSGEMPEPAVLEWVEQLGGGLWQPNSFNHLTWLQKRQPELELLDLHAAFRRCEKWFNRHQDELHWFENDDDSRDLAMQVIEQQIDPEADVFELMLEPHRKKWRDRFVQLAIRAQCNVQKSNPPWQDFALLALSLERGDPIADMPILPSVVDETLELATMDQLAEEMDDDAWDGVEDEDWDEELADDIFFERPEPAVSHKISRNAPCPCGSGKKYKKCCMP